jgi:hypothetical protein
MDGFDGITEREIQKLENSYSLSSEKVSIEKKSSKILERQIHQ